MIIHIGTKLISIKQAVWLACFMVRNCQPLTGGLVNTGVGVCVIGGVEVAVGVLVGSGV